MRSADCSRTRLGKTEVQDLALGDQIFYRTSHVFDWHFRIDAVLVVKINAVGSEALQRFLGYLLDVRRSAIESYGTIDLETKFGCDHDIVAERLERFSDKFLACKWTVNLGRIKERHALVMGCADNIDTLFMLAAGP
jgi:hypothetical protein